MRIFLSIILLWFFGSTGLAQELVERIFIQSYTRLEASQAVGVSLSYDLDLYKIRYTSKMIDGSPDTLSGLLIQPRSQNLLHPLLVYCHGTVSSREAVPSRLSFEHLIGVAFAGNGFAVIAPDYLGYGDSNQQIHPYVHAESEAWASYDMMSAVINGQQDLALLLNDQIFVTGYSQGGHASMALHRFLETSPDAAYEVTAAAHLSGPYDLSGVMTETTIGLDPYEFVSYLPLTYLSMKVAYPEFFGELNIDQVFKEDYVTPILQYVNEEIDLNVLNSELKSRLIAEVGASIPRTMFRDSFLNEILNVPNSTVNQALRDNDVYDWAPQMPTRIYYCIGDDQVSYRNALVADQAMKANGAQNLFTGNVGTSLNHVECVTPAVTLTLLFFNSFVNIVSDVEDLAETGDVSFYPNPATDMLFVKSATGKQGKLILYDLMGKEVTRSRIDNQLDISQVQTGIYLVRWESNDSRVTKKIVVRDF